MWHRRIFKSAVEYTLPELWRNNSAKGLRPWFDFSGSPSLPPKNRQTTQNLWLVKPALAPGGIYERCSSRNTTQAGWLWIFATCDFSFKPQQVWVGGLPPPDGHYACAFIPLLTLSTYSQPITATLRLPIHLQAAWHARPRGEIERLKKRSAFRGFAGEREKAIFPSTHLRFVGWSPWIRLIKDRLTKEGENPYLITCVCTGISRKNERQGDSQVMEVYIPS